MKRAFLRGKIKTFTTGLRLLVINPFTILPPSNVSLYGDVSTVGFYLLGIRGNHLFPQDKYRLNYNLYFYSFPIFYIIKEC